MRYVNHPSHASIPSANKGIDGNDDDDDDGNNAKDDDDDDVVVNNAKDKGDKDDVVNNDENNNVDGNPDETNQHTNGVDDNDDDDDIDNARGNEARPKATGALGVGMVKEHGADFTMLTIQSSAQWPWDLMTAPLGR